MIGPHAPNAKRCNQCGSPFMPARPLQRVCTARCATKLAKAAETARKLAQKVEKAQDRAKFKERKEAIKTIADLIAEAQRHCNAYIRARDKDKPCFCCGKPFEPQKRGGSMDAGHMRSRGAAGHLRFDENNIFGQRKNCNRPGGATEEARKAGAALRVGWDVVNAIYADNTPHKWERDELRQIAALYRSKLRELKAAQE